jgi:hypothetical protein
MADSTEKQMSKGSENSTVEEILPTRITFRIDSKQNWDTFNGTYNSTENLLKEQTIPLPGELGISVDEQNIIIYTGVNVLLPWYESFCVYNGGKSINFNPLYCFNEEETDEEKNVTIIWNEEKQIFEKTLVPVEFLNFDDGVLYFDSAQERWKIDSQYILIPTEIDSGIYNTGLSSPSFAGQSLSFAEQF